MERNYTHVGSTTIESDRHFWRCLRCRLLHFGDDQPLFCEHCDSHEFAMVLIQAAEAPASPFSLVA